MGRKDGMDKDNVINSEKEEQNGKERNERKEKGKKVRKERIGKEDPASSRSLAFER